MDEDRVGLLHGVLRSMTTLTRVFAARGTHPFKDRALGRREMDVMFFVSQSGTMTVRRLAEALGVTSGAISQVLPKLERIGLIAVDVDPLDRRHRLVRATASAAAEVTAFQDEYVRTLLPEFHPLSDSELVELDRLLAKVHSAQGVGDGAAAAVTPAAGRAVAAEFAAEAPSG